MRTLPDHRRGSIMAEMTTTMLPSSVQSNGTWCGSRAHTSTEVVIYIINQLLCLFGLAGNGTVLWLLTPNIRKKPFILYIFNLAVADFGYLILCLIVTSIFADEYFGSHIFPWCPLMPPLYSMELFLYSASIYFLTAISTERCLCALFPVWYRSHCHKWASAFVSAALWSFAFVLSGVNILYCSSGLKLECHTMAIIITVANLSIFTPFMILSSLTLFIKVRYRLQGRCTGHLYTVILVTVLCFFIFAIPLSIQLFLRELGYRKLPKIFYLLASVNSSINPVIYFLVGSYREKWFREPLRHILSRALNEEKSPGRGKRDGGVYSTDTEMTTSQGQKQDISSAEA